MYVYFCLCLLLCLLLCSRPGLLDHEWGKNTLHMLALCLLKGSALVSELAFKPFALQMANTICSKATSVLVLPAVIINSDHQKLHLY